MQRPHDTATDALRNCRDGPMARAHAGSHQLQEAEACLPRCGLHGPPAVWSTDPAAAATTERTTASGPTIVDKQGSRGGAPGGSPVTSAKFSRPRRSASMVRQGPAVADHEKSSGGLDLTR
eukprot:COSAG01_NODE_45_length_32100_cov_28.037218_13_plen_121_part_00